MNCSVKMFKLIVVFWLVVLTQVHCLEDGVGENICQKEESFVELEEEKTTHPVRIRSYNWCLSFPPRCSNYRTENRDVIKVQNVTKTKLVEHCCEGFNNINLNNNETIVCAPMCRGGCGHGTCDSPNTCLCDTGYEGRHCSERCRPRMYGKNCKSICKCRNNSLCDHKTGFCRCTTGWIGEFCEKPCPKGLYGVMCHKKCHCNDNKCDPYSGECLSDNSKIIFDVAHNRSSGVMKLSVDRIKAKHWIPVNGNGKINFRNCSDPVNQCDLSNGKKLNESVARPDQHNINKTALIQELNANLSNLTKELKSDNDKSVVINTTIAIHHIHKGGTDVLDDADTKQTASTEVYYVETENQDNIIYDQDDSRDGGSDLDSIDSYNDVVHVFAMSSINTTKSEQIMKLSPMVPVTLILMLVMCATFLIIFVAIYFTRKSKASQTQTQTDGCTPDDTTQSDQIVHQKPLPEIPSFTQSITRRIMQQDFYDRPSNNKSVVNGLNKLGYCYADDKNNRHRDESGACDEHIYDEIKYYRETTRR